MKGEGICWLRFGVGFGWRAWLDADVGWRPRHPHLSLLPSREKGSAGFRLGSVSSGGLGRNPLDSRFRGNDGGNNEGICRLLAPLAREHFPNLLQRVVYVGFGYAVVGDVAPALAASAAFYAAGDELAVDFVSVFALYVEEY